MSLNPSSTSLAVSFHSLPEAPAFVRRSLRELLIGVSDTASHPIELAASELAKNALAVAPTFDVRAWREPTLVRVEVEDAWPTWHYADPTAGEHGYGIRIVERVATRWGIRPTRAGKVVWFEVDL